MNGFKRFIVTSSVILFIGVQIWFVLSGQISGLVALSQTEDNLALQGHDPSVPRHNNQGVEEVEGAPMLGGIPVAFGENAPGSLPRRAGMPSNDGSEQDGVSTGGQPGKPEAVPGAMPGIPGKAGRGGKPGKKRAVPGAMPGIPGKAGQGGKPGLTAPIPGKVEATPGEVVPVPGKAQATPGKVEATPGKVEARPGKVEARPGKVEARPGKVEARPGKVEARPGLVVPRPGKVVARPGKVELKRGSEGQEGKPPEIDPYRLGLQIAYHLEKEGGALALTPMQARHLLRLIKANEDCRDSVPQAVSSLQTILTPQQLQYIRAQLSVQAANGQRTSPDLLDDYAKKTLKAINKKQNKHK